MYIRSVLTGKPHKFSHTFNVQTQPKTLKQTVFSLVNRAMPIREGAREMKANWGDTIN